MRPALALAILVLAAHSQAAALVLEPRAVVPPSDAGFREVVQDRFYSAGASELCAVAASMDCAALVEQACSGPRLPSKRTVAAYARAGALASGACPDDLKDALAADARDQEAARALCKRAKDVQGGAEKACGGKPPASLAAWFRDLDAACGSIRSMDAQSHRDAEAALAAIAKASASGCPGLPPTARKTRAAAVLADGVARAGASVGNGLPQAATLESLVLNGALTFVAARAKEEAVAFVVDRVSADLCERSAALLPATCQLVRAAEDAKSFIVPGRLLKQAIVDDLHALPGNLGRLMAENVAVSGADARAWSMLACGLQLGDGYYGGLLRQSPPVTLALGAIDRLGTVGVCRTALGFPDGGGEAPPWLPNGELVRTSVEALVRLVVHASDRDADAWERDVEALLKAIEERFPDLEPRIADVKAVARRLGPSVLRVRRAALTMRSAATDPDRASALRELIGASIDLVAVSADEILARARPASPAVERTRTVIVAMNRTASRLLQGDYAGGFSALLASGVVSASWGPYEELVRFSTLVVDVGAAQTSDEVAAAMERAAAPAGSWRVRRKRSTLGVSAKLGVIYAGEWLRADTALSGSEVLGLSLPIGIDGSIPLGRNWAAGLILHPIDLGNLARVRLDTDSVVVDGKTKEPKAEPEVGFAQVLSFGAQAYLGLWKSPFVLFLSGSYSPAHRVIVESTASGEVERTRDAWQFGVGLAVDVPIFIR